MAALTFNTSDATGSVDTSASADTIDRSDAVGLVDTSANADSLTPSDTTGLVDSWSSTPILLTITEAVGTTDTRERGITKTFNDNAVPRDRIAQSLTTPRDNAGITDARLTVSMATPRDDAGLADAVDTDLAVKLITVADLISTPGATTVTISGGVPLEVVTINLVGYGSNPLTTTSLDDAGNLAQSVFIPAGYTGAQSLQFVMASSGTVTVAFNAGSAPTGPTSPGAPTAPTPVITVRWVLEDVGPGGTTYTFPNNPKTMTSPHPRRTLTAEHSTSPDGQPLVWEGAARPYPWEFAGYCGTEAFYNALKLFVDIGRRFYLTDHRSRQWIVSFDLFDAQPRRDINNVWAHDYTMRATIYGGPL